MQILVIDADPDTQEGLATAFQLQWRDASMRAATTGEAGLDCFFEDDPDIVILNIALSRPLRLVGAG